jgi:hypothetical protein
MLDTRLVAIPDTDGELLHLLGRLEAFHINDPLSRFLYRGNGT